MSSKPPLRLSVPVNERDHIKGPDDAPVTVVEYGDYECPYCNRADLVVGEIQERTGNQVRLVYRHFPIATAHPHARRAAEAAEAAGSQGKFWEMHALLFQHQDALEEEDLLRYARQLELDTQQFERELRERVHGDRVKEDFRGGLKSGVNGTPTWFINDMRYDGAWDIESLLEAVERPMGLKIRLLTQEFTRFAALGGIMLLIFALLAMLWANSSLAHTYSELWETSLGFSLGTRTLSEHLLAWVNDGLMVIFFFVVGLEIKREITTGELSSPRKAALPIAAALGGMFAPAVIYVALNLNNPEALKGWGIPMATDIAFTLVILTVLGSRIPLSMKVFFTALAIADDLGAILVIAVFYTSEIHLNGLLLAAVFLLGLIVLNRWRVYSPWPYALLGFGLWFGFLESGIHPTIAGVLLALTIPTRSPARLSFLIAQTETALIQYKNSAEQSGRGQALLHSMQTITDRLEPPAQRLEHSLQPWISYMILPIFALANAGISLQADTLKNLLNPISLGITLGLVIGKPVGISLFSWLAVRSGLAEKPADITWRQLISASFLAGIGFTMSLFIASSAFEQTALLSDAKIGILVASALAAALGWTLLRLTSPSYDSVTSAKGDSD
ncbi:MAG TPA: Na+/H+ antiporter NhaA [Anaerolineales bacterium]|nr:Na+/H+ antiporter NhaA [Anaerolineales bacterium]